MNKVLKRNLVATLFLSLACSHLASANQLLGYYTNWDTYGRNYQPSNMPINDLTGVLYAFAEVGDCAAPYATNDNPSLCNKGATFTGVQDYQLHSSDPYSDFNQNWGKGNMSKVINIAHSNQKLALLSIGGYSLSVPLTTAMDANHRNAFIKSIIDFLATVKKDNPNADSFDGVDIDWEPYGNNWDDPRLTDQDINNFVTFLQQLKTALQQNNYTTLTIAAPANPQVVERIASASSANWKTLSAAVDYINVMSYDYHGGFDNPQITDFQAPLYFDPNQPASVSGRTNFNVDSTITTYLKAGVPANKLIVGFPAYGRAVAGVPNQAPANAPKAYGLYQTFTYTPQGQYDATGTFDYSYIIGHMLGQGYTDYQINTDQGIVGAAAYNPSNQYWISYDNVNSIAAKAQYVNNQKLAGMMVWELSGDVLPTDSSPVTTMAHLTYALQFQLIPQTTTIIFFAK